jgi:hypothetical protein
MSDTERPDGEGGQHGQQWPPYTPPQSGWQPSEQQNQPAEDEPEQHGEPQASPAAQQPGSGYVQAPSPTPDQPTTTFRSPYGPSG